MKIRNLLPAALTLAALTNFGGAVDLRLLDDTTTGGGANAAANFGTLPGIYLAASGPSRTYLKFDTASAFPTVPGPTVASDIGKATLRLFVNAFTAGGTLDVYPVTGPWAEGTLTQNSNVALGAIRYAGLPIAAPILGKFVDIDVTDLVKDWLSGTVVNNGIALWPGSAVGNAVNLVFDSKENVDTSHWPRLEVTLKIGAKGDTGATGPQGPTGPQGILGPQGVKGDPGATGDKGVKGDPGFTGSQGSVGPVGPVGPTPIRTAARGDLGMGEFTVGTAP